MHGAFNLFCLGVAVAGFSTLVSSLDRYRWRTIGIVVAALCHLDRSQAPGADNS